MQMQHQHLSTPLYPPGTSPVRKDKDLFILDVYYDYKNDFLKILYKRKDGTKFYDIIYNPQVPVFIDRSMKRTTYTKYVDTKSTYCQLVSYKHRETELQAILMGSKEISYTDKNTGKKVRRMIVEKLPRQAIYLNPNLFLADQPIEAIILYEFFNTRYHKSPDGKLMIDDVDIPELHVAGFDKHQCQLTW